jgi:hypothetical protein
MTRLHSKLFYSPLLIFWYGLIWIIASLVFETNAAYLWSFQQRIVLPSAGPTYGNTPSFIVGRGFQTLITGYSSTSEPGIYVHTNDDGYVFNHQNTWSLQARLVPDLQKPLDPIKVSDGFGTWMVANNQTLIVSAPYQGSERGFAYVFNGTLRHWSYIQRLQIAEANPNDHFGEKMHMSGDTLIGGATGTDSSSGAAYVFGRVGTSLFWTRQGRLIPRDFGSNQYFGQSVAVYGNTAVISAKNDDLRANTGSVYVFASTGGVWSQQQKLVALEMEQYVLKQNMEHLDLKLGDRVLGPACDINQNLDITVGVVNRDPGSKPPAVEFF